MPLAKQTAPWHQKIQMETRLMPEYIADVLHALRVAKIPSKAGGYRTHPFGQYCEHLRGFASQITQHELYAFDLSAINAASDLRIDTPDRVDRLVEAVLRSPRKIFIEGQADQVASINSGLRGFLDIAADADGAGPARWAAVIEVLGDGKARFQTMLMAPRSALKADPNIVAQRSFLRSLKGSLSDTVMSALSLSLSSEVGDVDVARHVGMSRSEFDQAFTHVQGGTDPIAVRANALLSEDPGPRRRGQILDAAWRATRFRDMIRVNAGRPEFNLPSSSEWSDRRSLQISLDALRDGLPIIAMLAVLQADASDLRAEPRRRAAGPRKAATGAKPKPSDMAPGLKIMTLNLEDRGLQNIYDQKPGQAAQAGYAQDTHARVRHPVRGHLFIARNGKLTWRRPHWRGSIEAPTLKRVIAPSHKR